MRKQFRTALLPACLLCLWACLSIGLAQGPYQSAKPSTEDKVRLTKLAKAYDAAKSIFAKSPKSAKAKKDFIDIGDAYANECMMTSVLDRKVKYRLALQVFRAVLKVSPNDKTAKGTSDFIIKIYKSLGRPVPQG